MRKFSLALLVITTIAEVFGGSDTSKKVLPCPYEQTFVPYSPSSDMNAPSGNAFAAGTYLDGSTVYVGTGNHSRCLNQKNVPARLSTNSANPGAYFVCAGTELYDSEQVQYLANDPNLIWVPTSSAAISSAIGVVTNSFNSYNFAFGRITLVDAEGNQYQKISKIHLNNAAVGMYYWNAGSRSVIMATTGFEILACQIYV